MTKHALEQETEQACNVIVRNQTVFPSGAGKTNLRFCDYYKTTDDAIIIKVEKAFDYLYLHNRSFIDQAKKYNSFVRTFFSMHFLPKILIISNQYPVLGKSLL